MKKKYISTGANPLSIDILDKGKIRTFDFTGGINNPTFKPPTFVTKDETEQKLLESHPTYGISFILDPMVQLVPIEPEVKTSEELTGNKAETPEITEDPETSETPETENQEEEDQSGNNDTTPKEETTPAEDSNVDQSNTSEEIPEETTPENTEAGTTPVPPSFKNLQEAKNWMVNNIQDVSANSVRNKELLMAKAKELNIKVVLESDNN